MLNDVSMVAAGALMVTVAFVDHFGPITESFGENLVIGLFGVVVLVVGWISAIERKVGK